jgi:hypothetical protein
MPDKMDVLDWRLETHGHAMTTCSFQSVITVIVDVSKLHMYDRRHRRPWTTFLPYNIANEIRKYCMVHGC